MAWTRIEYDPVTGHAVAATLPPNGAIVDRYLSAPGGHTMFTTGRILIRDCESVECGCGAPLAQMWHAYHSTVRLGPPDGVQVPDGLGDWWRPRQAPPTG